MTRGVISQTKGRITQLTVEAILSGNAAPMTFGVISQKIMIRKATTAVVKDSTEPLLPKAFRAIPAIRTGTKVLITLLPMRITDNNSSVLPKRPVANLAP